MAKSFKKIDYRLRPAKAVERRMMAEVFTRLRPFGAVETYRYVGMGSVYFSDFTLFHNVCGFETLVSIEDTEDTVIQDRFKFNVPIGHLDLKFGPSNTVLPSLPWDLRSVVWLDYDGGLTKEVLRDVGYLASKVCTGSLLSLSLNARLTDEEDETKRNLEVLTDRIGSRSKIPSWITSSTSIRPQEVIRAHRDIVSQEIRDALNNRNAGRPTGQRYVSEQVFYFTYKDGAQMLTLGWLIIEEGQRALFDQCAFDTLRFVKRGEEPFDISVPLLTNAEMREVNRCDEAGTFQKLEELPLPPSEVAKFNQLRRYWPVTSFSEMN